MPNIAHLMGFIDCLVLLMQCLTGIDCIRDIYLFFMNAAFDSSNGIVRSMSH